MGGLIYDVSWGGRQVVSWEAHHPKGCLRLEDVFTHLYSCGPEAQVSSSHGFLHRAAHDTADSFPWSEQSKRVQPRSCNILYDVSSELIYHHSWYSGIAVEPGHLHSHGSINLVNSILSLCTLVQAWWPAKGISTIINVPFLFHL